MANETTAVAVKRETVDVVLSKVQGFKNSGELVFPPNYSPENALKSAWLIIQETTDLNKRPALEVCTKESIANALLSMTIQALNPDKKQCYFIVYGKQLQMQRSYFGSIAVAKSVSNGKVVDIIPEVIYEGDVFEYTKKRGKTIVLKHEQSFDNINKDNIKGAYATIIYADDTEESILMTMDQIKQSWKQSKMNPIDDKGNLKSTSTHAKFTEEMAKKTVVNRACKMIINSSDDSNLLLDTVRKTEDAGIEYEAEVVISENAHKQIVDIDTGEIVEVDPESIIISEAEEPTQEQIEINEEPGF